MPLIVRKGDTGSHGGVIVTGSPDTLCEGRQVARVTDTYNCDIHGPNPIVEGSPKFYANGLRIVRHGDLASCGASMISGATKSEVD